MDSDRNTEFCAFCDWYETYYGEVFHYASYLVKKHLGIAGSHETARDVVHEALTSILKKTKSGMEIVDHHHFVNIWKKGVYWKTLELLKKVIRERDRLSASSSPCPSSNTTGSDPSRAAEFVDDVEKLRRGMDGLLTDFERRVLWLRAVEELNYREIGQVIGASGNWARVIYLKATRKLQIYFDVPVRHIG